MEVSKRISSFIELGNKLGEKRSEWEEWALQSQRYNKWFTKENVFYALESIIEMLQEDKIFKWLQTYDLQVKTRKVGVIMAGNIPMVGFHDFMCVLLANHIAYIKPSSSDPYLIKVITDLLISINPDLENYIIFPEKLKDIDAVIATGSDNTSKYFHFYFSSIPHIIRKNRTSVGVIRGNETDSELSRLGSDVFNYFGLGCRNVSKLYVPKNYDWNHFFQSIEEFSFIRNNNKYFNNYEYHKAIYLIDLTHHLDNGFLLLLQNAELVSPVSVLYYEEYLEPEDLNDKLKKAEEKVQIITSSDGWFPNSIPFGQAQKPCPWDYADNVDTLKFLTCI